MRVEKSIKHFIKIEKLRKFLSKDSASGRCHVMGYGFYFYIYKRFVTKENEIFNNFSLFTLFILI